jgi:hypothetical protein
MLVGHVAVGLTVKRLQPTLSLGTLVCAAMLADLLWCIFMIAGLEHVQFKPGRGAANYFVATNIAMSHSLLMDGLWAALFAAIYFGVRRDRRGAWIVFFAVLSHWVLDFISHRPDMPLAPKRSYLLGARSLEFRPGSRSCGRLVLVYRGNPFRPCYERKKTGGRLLVLDRCRYSHVALVQQSNRATASRSIPGSLCQLGFVFSGSRLGLLDEFAPSDQSAAILRSAWHRHGRSSGELLQALSGNFPASG